MLKKRWIILPVLYSRPFAPKAVFWAMLKESAIYWVRPLGTVNGELKLLQNRSKTAFEAKGLQYTTDKVSESQRLFNVDLYTYLAIYHYGWGKW